MPRHLLKCHLQSDSGFSKEDEGMHNLGFQQKEDFGKRNMPGKRARRHLSQLSEFERGLIIGMKTAGWSTHRVAGQTLPWPACFPDFSPAEHVWDQLKRQMPSCHSVYDLELAVQDLLAHLPQANIRCLINSIPDRVAACIAAGDGPMRY
ncbi:uncharacterized protein TNCV_197331 [Trichonephila clavipes]|nr:uncharacterized protein TNCV_197331 [Trichonephila clavipes]